MTKRAKRKAFVTKACLLFLAVVTAILFLTPIVLTITNSFMSASEISSNYGVIFQNATSDGKTYISETVNLKFIPDMVSFSQYITTLFTLLPKTRHETLLCDDEGWCFP